MGITLNQPPINGLAASNTTYTSGTISVTGVGGGVTVSSNTGQRIDISVAAPVAQTVQVVQSAIAASNTTYTSGLVTITGVGGGITVSSNTGQRIDLSVAAPVAQTVQTQNVVDVSLSGNTAGAMALVSSGTLTLAGGNNITLSQAGNAVTISGAAAGGAQTAISGVAASNTTYTSGTVTFSGVGGGITVSSNTGQRVDLSVAAQSVQTQGVSALAASNTTYTSGAVLLTGSNMVTVKSSGAGQTVIIDATQSVQIVQSAIAASNTTYTSGLVTITGVGGGVTVSSNTGQRIDISVAAPVAQTVQTQNLHNVTLSGNTAGVMAQISSGTMTLAGGNNITLSQNGNAVTISGAAAGGAQTAISGIVASNTTYTSGTVQFTGSNMVTVKSSGAGQTVIIDATQSIQTQSVMQAGVSNLGNTAGATGISGTQLVLVGTNGITLSQTTGANGATVSISAGGGGGGVNIAASNTTYTSGTVVFSASDGSRSAISIASVGAQSVIVSDAGPTMDYWARGEPVAANAFNIGANTQIQFMFPLMPRGPNRFEGQMTASEFRVHVSYNYSQTSLSQQLSSTMSLYLYTRSSNSLKMLNSASMTFGNTNASTANTSRWNGIRALVIPATSNWSATPTFVYGGEYYVGLRFQTHITTAQFSYINIGNSGLTGVSGTAGGNSNTNMFYRPGYGNYGNLGSSTIVLSDITFGANGSHDPYVVMVHATGVTF